MVVEPRGELSEKEKRRGKGKRGEGKRKRKQEKGKKEGKEKEKKRKKGKRKQKEMLNHVGLYTLGAFLFYCPKRPIFECPCAPASRPRNVF